MRDLQKLWKGNTPSLSSKPGLGGGSYLMPFAVRTGAFLSRGAMTKGGTLWLVPLVRTAI